MPHGTRVRRKKAGRRVKTRRLRKQHLRTRRKVNRRKRGGMPSPTRRETIKEAAGIAPTVGTKLLDMFYSRDPGAVAIAKHLKPQDIIQIMRCHPQLWHNRHILLKTLFKHSIPDVNIALEAARRSSLHTAALCKHVSSHNSSHSKSVLHSLILTLGSILVQTKQNQILYNLIQNSGAYTKGTEDFEAKHIVWKAIHAENYEALKWLIDYFNIDKKLVINNSLELDDAIMSALRNDDFDTAEWLRTRLGVTEADYPLENVDVQWLLNDFEDRPEAQKWLTEKIGIPKDYWRNLNKE